MLMNKNLSGGGPVYGEAVKKLAELAAKDNFVTGQGSVKNVDVRDAYIERLLQAYKSPRPLKIVWDCGNGASGAKSFSACRKNCLASTTVLFPATLTVIFPIIMIPIRAI